MFIVAVFLFSLPETAVSAPFWKSKEEKKPTSESKKVSAKPVRADKAKPKDSGAVGSPLVPRVPAPTRLPPGLETVSRAGVPEIDLDAITKTQKELQVLANRYEDLRRTQEEQLISLRALASQARIHSQLLNGLKDQFSTVPDNTSVIPAGLDAANLEKYRLIRERVSAQQKTVSDIAQSQQRLKAALRATNLPNPPPSVRLAAGIGAPSNPSLEAVRSANDIQAATNAAQSAKEAKEKAEEEKAKMEKEKKEKVAMVKGKKEKGKK